MEKQPIITADNVAEALTVILQERNSDKRFISGCASDFKKLKEDYKTLSNQLYEANNRAAHSARANALLRAEIARVKTDTWYFKDFQVQLANYENIVIPQYEQELKTIRAANSELLQICSEYRTEILNEIDAFSELAGVTNNKNKRIQILEKRLKPFEKAQMENHRSRIEMENAGCARR